MVKISIKKVEDAAEVAQKMILELYHSDPTNITFEQNGLLNGQETVSDFINHGEWGLALEHLLYMIHESDIRFPRNILLELHDIADSNGIANHYSKQNQLTSPRNGP